jgi:hypothetical protein
MSTRTKRALPRLFLAVTTLSFVAVANAMELRVDGSQLIATGRVTGDEFVTVRDAVGRNPQIDTIVFANSPGGDVWTAIHLANWIRGRKLSTVVHGGCLSACALLFLAGADRRFSTHPGSVLGFNGPTSSGLFDNGKFSYQSAWSLITHMMKYTDGKGDREFFKAIVYMSADYPRSATYFMNPGMPTRHGASVFTCKRDEPKKDRLAHCEKLADRAADKLGIVTTLETVAVSLPGAANPSGAAKTKATPDTEAAAGSGHDPEQ